LRSLRKKHKEEGPFKANRILNTKELKIDQVFTREGEKPVALFTHANEREAQKIEAKGFAGPVGGQVAFASGKEGVTRGYYFSDNISEREIKEKRDEILTAANTMGSAIPKDVTFTRVGKGESVPMTSSTVLTATRSGSVGISGGFLVSGEPQDLMKSWKTCSHCGCPNQVVEDSDNPQYCSYCGKNLDTNYS
jgi:hypothetical protein